MIYAIRCETFVKFGQSAYATAETRLNELQTGNPFELVIMATANWPDREEGRIHRYLAEQRIRGEWFTICDKSNAVIDVMKHDISEWHALYVAAHPRRLRKVAELSLSRA